MNINNLLAMLENGIAKLRDPLTTDSDREKILQVMAGLTRQAHAQQVMDNQMKEIEHA